MGIKPAQRVGLPAFRAVGMEQKIVKVPENEVVVAFRRPKAVAAGRVDFEKNLAVHQQGKKLKPRKAVLPPQPADFLRCRQRGDGGRDVRIAKFEQRAGAWRFQHHLIATSPQVGKA